MASPPNLDRVQAVKWESSAKGGTQEDTYPAGLSETEDALSARGFYGQPSGGPADEECLIWRDGNNWKLQDKAKGPVTLTELLIEADHLALDTLTHHLDETHDVIVNRGGDNKVTSIVHQTIGLTPVKIREIIPSRSGGRIISIVLKQYDSLGVLKETLTGTINRTSNRVSSINWVRS